MKKQPYMAKKQEQIDIIRKKIDHMGHKSHKQMGKKTTHRSTKSMCVWGGGHKHLENKTRNEQISNPTKDK